MDASNIAHVSVIVPKMRNSSVMRSTEPTKASVAPWYVSSFFVEMVYTNKAAVIAPHALTKNKGISL